MNLRWATVVDAEALADILRTCFRVSLPFLPQLHTPDVRYAWSPRD